MINKVIILSLFLITLTNCAIAEDTFHDVNMDFGAIQNIAVLPLANLTKDMQAGDRVRDVFLIKLMATSGIYVIPVGEVTKAIVTTGVSNPTAPDKDSIIKLALALRADAVITGVVREYGELRAGTTSANVISMSLQMTEAQTGRVVWSSSSTKGGISFKDRLLGGGGYPLNDVTEKAIDDLINKLFM